MFNQLALQQIPEKLQPLCQILQQASQILDSEYQHYLAGDRFEIMHKADDSPVTQADMKCHRYIQQQLQAISSLPILSEEDAEQTRQDWGDFWLLDPLDGTKEFLQKSGEFCINLSLIVEGESVISAIAVPLQRRIYIAEKGGLPYRYHWSAQHKPFVARYQAAEANLERSSPLRIAVSHHARSEDYAQFFAYLDQQALPYSTVAIGSAYKFCLMLEGEVDIYPRFHPTYEWDTAAGQGLLQSIGGDVFDLAQRPFRYNQRKALINRCFIAFSRHADWQLLAQFGQNLVSKN